MRTIGLLTILHLCCGLLAQSPHEDIPILYKQDILLGAEVFRLSVREIDESGAVEYYFTLQEGTLYTAITCFRMVELSPSAFNNEILEAQLKSALPMLSSRTNQLLEALVKPLKKNVANSTALVYSLTATDSSRLEKALKLVQKRYTYNADSAQAVLAPLLGKTSSRDSLYLLDLLEPSYEETEEVSRTLDQVLARISSEFLHEAEQRIFLASNSGVPVGKIRIRDTVNVYKGKDSLSGHRLIIKSAQLKFENGQLAGIKVAGQVQDSKKRLVDVLFHNRLPISYSTKADIATDYYVVKNVRLFTPNEWINGHHIKLSDVLQNDYQLLGRTENYAPEDGTMTVHPKEAARVVYKERVTNLLHARIFSDFVGLDDSQPNGLVQAEFSKRVFLNTVSKGLCGWFKHTYWGHLNYIEPNLMITKLEDNNKAFSLDGEQIRALDAFLFQNFSTGGHLNLGYIGNYRTHALLRLDLGLAFQRTVVQEAGEAVSRNINSVSYYPRLVLDFLPHPNYEFSLDYQWRFLSTLDEAVSNPYDGVFEARNSFHSLGFIASIRLNETREGQFFFRSRFNVSHEDPKHNFLEAQVGYAFHIFSRPPTLKTPNPLRALD